MVSKVRVLFRGREIEFLTPRTYWYYANSSHDVRLYIKYIICKLLQNSINEVSPIEITVLISKLLCVEERRRGWKCENSILHDVLIILQTLFKSKRLYDGMGIPSQRQVISVIKEIRKEIEKNGLENVLKRYLLPEERIEKF